MNDQSEKLTLETPFLDSPTLSSEVFETDILSTIIAEPWTVTETPFQNDQFLLEGENNQLAQSVAELLQSLRDDEFEEVLYEMAVNAQEITSQSLSSEYLPAAQAEVEAERMLSQHFAPLAVEAHRMYDRMIEGLVRYDLSTSSEVELEAILDQFAPDTTSLAPEQQNFLGKLFNKAKQAVSGAVNLARKGIATVGKGVKAIGGVVLGPLLNKLKAMVMPLLKRVIGFAMSKLPAKVRPVAQILARKILGTSLEVADFETTTDHAMSCESPAYIQQEYDLLVAEALITEGEFNEGVVAEQFAIMTPQGEDPVARLSEARDALVQGLMKLEAGQDPKPVIQQFLPAALLALQPIIRTAIGIIGRDKVVNFLSGLLAQLVSKWVGQEPAKMIATPIVSTGLSLLGFETTPDSREYAAEVLAQTLQETVVTLAQQPAATFESPILTQIAVQEGFEQAAAANFPAEILKQELREAAEATGSWVLLPGNKRRKYYKKYSQVHDISLSRKLVETIKVFGGVSLADYLEATRLLSLKQPIKTKLHLYELNFGARLADIAVRERNVNGLGNAHWSSWSQILPFTPETATALLREPGLGKQVDSTYLAGPYLVAPGQRFYYLELPAPLRSRIKPLTTPRTGGPNPQKCTANRVGVIVDIPKESLIIKMRLMEDNAQSISQALKRNDIAGAFQVVRTMRNVLKEVLNGSTQTGLSVIYPASTAQELMDQLAPAAAGGLATSALGWVLNKIGDKITDLVWQWIENYFKNKSQEFIVAADDAADGVTLFITFNNLKLLSVVREVLQGNYARAALSLVSPQIPYPNIYTAKGCLT